MKIPLSGKKGQGKYTLISPQDSKIIKQHNWWLHKYGYATTRIEGKSIPLHKLLIRTEKYIDHKNLDRLDNRRENLRVCTFEQNLGNSKPRHGKKYKGVYFENTGKPKCWHVKVTHNKKQISFGRYKTELEAAKIYDKNIKKLRGEFAWLNFPEK